MPLCLKSPFTGDIGDIDVGLATPMEVYQSLAAEGYQMSHRRAPLSRERTPEAADLDVLYHQLLIQPEGKLTAPCISFLMKIMALSCLSG